MNYPFGVLQREAAVQLSDEERVGEVGPVEAAAINVAACEHC